jgi:hypothetical protein
VNKELDYLIRQLDIEVNEYNRICDLLKEQRKKILQVLHFLKDIKQTQDDKDKINVLLDKRIK